MNNCRPLLGELALLISWRLSHSGLTVSPGDLVFLVLARSLTLHVISCGMVR